jgi:hypothetical protein
VSEVFATTEIPGLCALLVDLRGSPAQTDERPMLQGGVDNRPVRRVIGGDDSGRASSHGRKAEFRSMERKKDEFERASRDSSHRRGMLQVDLRRNHKQTLPERRSTDAV